MFPAIKMKNSVCPQKLDCQADSGTGRLGHNNRYTCDRITTLDVLAAKLDELEIIEVQVHSGTC